MCACVRVCVCVCMCVCMYVCVSVRVTRFTYRAIGGVLPDVHLAAVARLAVAVAEARQALADARPSMR